MTDTPRFGGWMQTYSGQKFYPLDAVADEIHIEDIAHHLANTARFNGATLGYYSVAQHSVFVSKTCKPENALWGLLHDSAEAYLGDMIRPLKKGPGMEAFGKFEDDLMSVVAARFGLPWPEPDDVKYADAVLLKTEKRDLLRHMQDDMDEVEWLHGAKNVPPLTYSLWPLDPAHAEALFLERYYDLTLKPAPHTGTPYDSAVHG